MNVAIGSDFSLSVDGVLPIRIAKGALLVDPGTPPATATPLIYSDFENGIYRINNVTKTLSEVWEENALFGAFSPTRIFPGVGFKVAYGDAPLPNSGGYGHYLAATLTDEGFAALTRGHILIVEYTLSQVLPTDAPAIVGGCQPANWSNEWYWQIKQNSSSTEISTLDDYDGFVLSPPYTASGRGKMAFRQSETGYLEISSRGSSVLPFQSTTPALVFDTAYISVVGHGSVGASATIHSAEYYPYDAGADLTALSV